MYPIEAIPSHILQNVEIIKANVRSIMSNVNIDQDFSSMLNSAINDITSTFSPTDFSTDVKTSNAPYSNVPGIYSNNGFSNSTSIAKLLGVNNQDDVINAYDTLLKSNISSIVPNIINPKKKDVLEKIKGLDKNTSLITDEEFFDAKALTAEEINTILKKKNSPYADMKFQGNKTVGELIYEECHKAGNINKGPRTINPAMILAIMGAESNFGKNAKNIANPFNVKVNGSFNNVKSFEESLNIAVNTMYNLAIDRPNDSKISLLDYAGDKYCENYSVNWKPSVERYFLEFSIKDDIVANNSDSLKSINEILTKINPLNTITEDNTNPINNLNLLLPMKNINNIGNTEEE
ncbi:MAG: hypothetical protein KatS3mg068_0383 [Candidatus Sericytochromatia bacterium]|nr:MAG: hypothetical protein KatS3mg068_0383 [Candidatus Sericytochromatia bacterium]